MKLHKDQWERVRQRHESIPLADRQNLADPIFTQSAVELLQSARESVTEAINSFHDPLRRKVILDYLKKLEQLTDQNRAENKDVTQLWAVLLGHHVATLHNILLGHESVYPRGGDIEGLIEELIAKSQKRTELYLDHESFLGQAILLPTTGDLTVGDLIEAQSNNILPLGVISKDAVADGGIFDPKNFYVHDLAHAAGWIGAKKYIIQRMISEKDGAWPHGTIDLVSSPIAKELSRKVESVYNSIIEFSPEKRKAGEAFLFMLMHENASVGIRLYFSDDIHEINTILEAEVQRFLPRLIDPKAVGADFPDLAYPRASNEQRMKFIRLGESAVREAIQKLQAH